MTTFCHSITGGDYERAGLATDALKDLLKTLGVDPESTRRVAIAAYEAELNVIIHARRGDLRATLGHQRLDVEIDDEGPGIADIPLALQPGFSTAPQAARALGFGAGLGLPNIQRHTDDFSLDSTVGVGCKLRFAVVFSCVEPLPAAPNSLRFASERCRVCLHCLSACPTQALRVRGRGPTLLAHRCVDCNACVAACAHGAIELDSDSPCPNADDVDVLVLPLAFLTDFGPATSPRRVHDALREMGFSRIAVTETWERAQRRALEDILAHGTHPLPLLDTSCPVVTRFVETRFPSLLDHLAPLLSPVEAAAAQLKDCRAAFVVACPAERTCLRQAGVPDDRILAPRTLRQKLDPSLAVGRGSPGDPVASPPDHAPASTRWPLVASGLPSILQVLEALEAERVGPVDLVMLKACKDGCFGSPLFRTPSPVAAHRAQHAPLVDDVPRPAAMRGTPYRARSALRLDPDMQASVKKLHRMAEALRSLPQADCARCGAPTCRSQAEDFALGRIRILQCKHPSARRAP